MNESSGMWMIIIPIGGGLLLLYFGAEGLVRGSAALAMRLGVSPLLIGLTIVAYGTSMPELLVSVTASFEGYGEIAVGNVVGSNIFNVAFILGVSALIFPLQVKTRLVRIDLPVMIVVSVLCLGLLLDHRLGRIEGIILFSGALLYTILNAVFARREPDENIPSEIGVDVLRTNKRYAVLILMILGGLFLLVAGSKLLVQGAVSLALALGVSKAVISLTIISAGTSLPELATSAIASLRKLPDIAIGNIVGSNIFNILCILGISSIVSPLMSIGIHLADLLIMSGIAMITLPLMSTRHSLSRWEGALLSALYVLYVVHLWHK